MNLAHHVILAASDVTEAFEYHAIVVPIAVRPYGMHCLSSRVVS